MQFTTWYCINACVCVCALLYCTVALYNSTAPVLGITVCWGYIASACKSLFSFRFSIGCATCFLNLLQYSIQTCRKSIHTSEFWLESDLDFWKSPLILNLCALIPIPQLDQRSAAQYSVTVLASKREHGFFLLLITFSPTLFVPFVVVLSLVPNHVAAPESTMSLFHLLSVSHFLNITRAAEAASAADIG